MRSSFVLSIILMATRSPELTRRASFTTAKCPRPKVRPRRYSPLRSVRRGPLPGSGGPFGVPADSPGGSIGRRRGRSCGRARGGDARVLNGGQQPERAKKRQPNNAKCPGHLQEVSQSFISGRCSFKLTSEDQVLIYEERGARLRSVSNNTRPAQMAPLINTVTGHLNVCTWMCAFVLVRH